jgi:hypothetical protein
MYAAACASASGRCSRSSASSAAWSSRVGELVAQVAHRLVGGEQADPDHLAAGGQRGVVAAGRDHGAPGHGGRRPQLVQVGRIDQVVQHHQPPPVRAGEPGQKPLRRLVLVRIRNAADTADDSLGGLGVAGDDAAARRGGDPDQQIHLPPLPHAVRDGSGELGFPHPTKPGQHLAHRSRRARGQFDVRATVLTAVRQRRHHTDPVRPAHRRTHGDRHRRVEHTEGAVVGAESG